MIHTTCPECGNNFLTQHRLEDGSLVGQCKSCLHTWPEEAKYFTGEMMRCALCGKEEQSDPDVSTNWRVLEFGDSVHYVCSRHFPHDRASAADFRHAYRYVLKKLTRLAQ